jgi:hypothetical protein
MEVLVCFVVICLAGQWLAFRVTRRSERVGAMWTLVLLLAVCAKSALDALPSLEWALLPWPAYALVQPLVMYPLAAMFFGVAASRLPVRWNRIVVLLVGVGVIGYGAQRNAWIAWPEAHGQSIYADAGHHLQQSTHYTCGPAACVAAVSHCGVRISERDMARLCLTRVHGSRLFDLYRGIVLALERQAYEVSILPLTAEQVVEPERITVSSNRGGGHAICLVGQGTDALVHDPLDREPERWDLDRVRREYRAPAIVIEARTSTTNPAAATPR